MKKVSWGLPAILLAALFFFCASTADAQAWRKDGQFTQGAKIALHGVWGSHMGYANPAETARIADSIFKKSSFSGLLVRNSGVTATGTIKSLPVGTYPVAFLGTTDATLLGESAGMTANLYLKEGCGNLGWVLVQGCLPPSNVRISGQSLGGGQVRLTATWTPGSNGGTETVTWMVGATTVGTGATATFTPPSGTTTYIATIQNTCGQASASHQVVVAAPAAPTGTTTTPVPTRPAATATTYNLAAPAGQYARPVAPIACQPVFWGSNQVPCWRDPVGGIFFSFSLVIGWTKCWVPRHSCYCWCPAPPPPTWSCPAPPPPGRVPVVVLDHGDGDGGTGDPVAGTDSGNGDGNGSGETGEPWDPTDPDPGDGTGETGDPWPGGDTGGGDLVTPIPPAVFEPVPQAAYQLVDGGYSPNPPAGARRISPGDRTPMATYTPMSGEGVNSPNPAYQPFPQGTAGGNFPTSYPGASWSNQRSGTYQGARTHGTQVTPGASGTPGTVRHHGTAVQPGGPPAPPPGRTPPSPPGG